MVVMSLKTYEGVTQNIEARLDEADIEAERTKERLSHSEVFDSLKKRIRS